MGEATAVRSLSETHTQARNQHFRGHDMDLHWQVMVCLLRIRDFQYWGFGVCLYVNNTSSLGIDSIYRSNAADWLIGYLELKGNGHSPYISPILVTVHRFMSSQHEPIIVGPLCACTANIQTKVNTLFCEFIPPFLHSVMSLSTCLKKSWSQNDV